MKTDEKSKILVQCDNCGNVWKTKAKRPQCPACKTYKVIPLSSNDENREIDDENKKTDYEKIAEETQKSDEQSEKESKQKKKSMKEEKLTKLTKKIHQKSSIDEKVDEILKDEEKKNKKGIGIIATIIAIIIIGIWFLFFRSSEKFQEDTNEYRTFERFGRKFGYRGW